MNIVTMDTAIIGAGPAGLSAALTLGRARRTVLLFDNQTNRNRRTTQSHGFLTRDGITPADFRATALAELAAYPDVHYVEATITNITTLSNNLIQITTADHTLFVVEKTLLATGIQEVFPAIAGIEQSYGKSLFSCPYCDGWELRDQKLFIIAEQEVYALHLSKLLYHWSSDLILATNGTILSADTMEQLAKNNITVITDSIKELRHTDGYITQMVFASMQQLTVSYGFIAPSFTRANVFADMLECMQDEHGSLVLDPYGRTSVTNIYAAGETTSLRPSSLMIAAAEGNKAAIAMNGDMAEERF